MVDEALSLAEKSEEGNLLGAEKMKITITIEDTEDGQVNVTESRLPGDGETEESVTSATALADAMFEAMDHGGG